MKYILDMDKLHSTSQDAKTVDVFVHLLLNFKKILAIALFFTFISITFYILFANDKYTATGILEKTIYSPNNQSSTSNPLSSLAALGGMSLSEGGSNEKVIVKQIQTRSFFNDLVDLNPSYPQKIFASYEYDKNRNELFYKDSLYDDSKSLWVKSINQQSIHEEYLDNLSISFNIDDGLIYISYEHVSPLFASEIINSISSLYNLNHRDKAIAESIEAVNFLTQKLNATKYPYISQYLASLIQNHLQQNMFANIRPAVSFIEFPYIPDNKSSFGIVFYFILGMLIGSVIGCIYVLFKSNLIRE